MLRTVTGNNPLLSSLRTILGAEVETADSLQTKTFWCLMADGQLGSIWPQLLYAKRTLSPVRLVLKVTLFLLQYYTGVFLWIWWVLTRLDYKSTIGQQEANFTEIFKYWVSTVHYSCNNPNWKYTHISFFNHVHLIGRSFWLESLYMLPFCLLAL